MTVKVFVLTPFLFKVLRGKGFLHACRECGYSFEIGDIIVSVHGHKTRWYCRECAVKFEFISKNLR
jgi:hypothetical protein